MLNHNLRFKAVSSLNKIGAGEVFKTYFIVSTLFLLAFSNITAQSVTQTILGKVINQETTRPISGAIIRLISDSAIIGFGTSDSTGNYKMTDISLGRYSVSATHIGFKQVFLPNICVNSGKETILDIELEERAINLKEVSISKSIGEEPMNSMADGSVNSLAIEEATKYAGARDDPARMLSNYAGVGGADDTRNDMVIRGNSPLGFLWRFEGVDIPNPNHFAIEGATGGSVNIINPKVLSNSDFMSGAYPAEYGNSLSGVLDLKMRSGNNEKHEFTGSLGVLGAELTTEGPLSVTKAASYIVTYRYSTLKLFESFKIPIGTNAVPNYQDASVKLNFPMKKGSSISFFFLGGISSINTLVSTYKKPQDEIYVQQDRDQYFGSAMCATGLVYSYLTTSSSYIKMTLATTASETHDRDNLVYRDSAFRVDSLVPKLGYKYFELKNCFNFLFHIALNSKLSIQTGVLASWYHFSMNDSNYNQVTYKFENRLNYKGSAFLFQPYIEGRFKITDFLSLTGGLHGQHFTLNGSSSIEPRTAIKWRLSPQQSLYFGYGMYSQMQPTYIYFYHLPSSSGDYNMQNRSLAFTHSSHYVLGFKYLLRKMLKLKVETYYQYLTNIPVDINKSAFSMVNEGLERFYPNTLVNAGTAKNYGIELTLEQYACHSYSFLLTFSLYNSTYKGSDGIERPTDFNRDYILNLLTGKEFKFTEHHSFAIGFKVTTTGGKRYTPLNVSASKQKWENVYIDTLTNTLRFKPYFRIDLKIRYKINTRKLTHQIGIDCVNILNTKNVLSVTYSPMQNNQLIETYQLGFLPILYYQFDF
jgi:hypothetical protein